MGKLVSVVCVGLAVIVGLVHWGRSANSASPRQEPPQGQRQEKGQDDERPGDAAVPAIVPKRLLPVPSTALGVDDGAKPVAGISVGPVPDALAAHLGDRVRSGLLAVDVALNSAAAKAGLRAFDIIVAVGDATASRAALRAAVDGGDEVCLHIIRHGLDRIVTFRARAPIQVGAKFLSSATLGADHPFRKLAALATLRRSYEASANRHRREMKALREKTREAERAAERERASLLRRCTSDVAKYVDAWRDRLLERVEKRMNAGDVRSLRALRLAPERLLPAADVKAVRAAVDRAAKALARMKSLPSTTALDGTLARHRRRMLEHDADHLIDRYGDRIARPWRSTLKSLAKHRRKLDEFPKRLHDIEADHRAIRLELRERIACAAKRIKKSFGKQLKKRIRKHEVPKPGEIEAALRDVCGQAEHLADRFLARVDHAVGRAEAEWTAANRRLETVCERERGGLVAAFRAMEQRFAGLFAHDDKTASASPSSASTWQQRASVEDEVEALSRRTLTALNASRDATRPPQVTIIAAFHEHRVVDGDTNEDLRSALVHIRSEAANHCWKLDGPHLDGRFPRKKPTRIGNPLVVRADG